MADVLRSLTLFDDLDDDGLAIVVARSRRRRYDRGARVFEVGDPGDSLLVVLSGRLQVTVYSADGGELILTVLGPGAVLGELGVVDGGARSAAAAALERTEVLVIPRAVVLDLIERFPGVAVHLLESVAGSLRRLTDATADLVFLDLPRRLAKLLLDAPRSGDGTVDLGLNQSQLAARIGGTRQSVNAALHGFERRGWLATDGRTVRLADAAAMIRFAGA